MIEANPEYLAGYVPVVTDGVLMVNNINAQGDELPLRFAGPGSLILESYYDSPVVIYALTRGFATQYREGTAQLLSQGFMEVQAQYARRIQDTSGLTANRRLLLLLQELAELVRVLPEDNQDVLLTQVELSGIVQCTRERIGKHMIRLERDGVIQLGYGKFTFQDTEKLRCMIQAQEALYL